MSEFSLINEYFSQMGEVRQDVELGVGDDAAIIDIAGQKVCVSVDTLVSGVHFPETTTAEDIAFKSLAVNLSDMAAMGARPTWATLALSLTEQQNEPWVHGFSQSLDQLARQFNVQIIGGDTTRSETLTISIQIMGVVDDGRPLLRSGAKVGDAIYVTGHIGDAGIGLQRVLAHDESHPYFIERLNRPSARVKESLLLKDCIHAAIDISDGFIADLGHILTASGVGATVELDRIPLSPDVKKNPENYGGFDSLLSSGDDYELCFCVPADKVALVDELAVKNDFLITRVGDIQEQSGLSFLDASGNSVTMNKTGFDHFNKG